MSALPVSPTTRITHEDYARMHTTRGSRPLRHKAFIPEWANNDKLLRLVISQRIYRYVNYRYAALVSDDLIADLPSLTAVANRQFEAMVARPPQAGQRESFQKHVDAVRRAGGYAALVAATAYRAFRLCEDSVTIARELGISPVCVRQNLTRLRRCARALGLEGPSTHWSAKPHPETVLVLTKPPRAPVTAEEMRAHQSASAKLRCARLTPEERSAIARRILSSPEVRAHMSAASKRRWARPGEREARSASAKAAWARGDYRNRKRARA